MSAHPLEHFVGPALLELPDGTIAVRADLSIRRVRADPAEPESVSGRGTVNGPHIVASLTGQHVVLGLGDGRRVTCLVAGYRILRDGTVTLDVM